VQLSSVIGNTLGGAPSPATPHAARKPISAAPAEVTTRFMPPGPPRWRQRRPTPRRWSSAPSAASPAARGASPPGGTAAPAAPPTPGPRARSAG